MVDADAQAAQPLAATRAQEKLDAWRTERWYARTDDAEIGYDDPIEVGD